MSTIEIPTGSGFGLQNLPYGVFEPPGESLRVGVRVGNSVVDLARALGDDVFAKPSLNAFMAQGYDRWRQVRGQLTELIESESVPAEATFDVDDVVLHMPFDVADYVDFYASEHHASNLGRLFRPGAEPLMPNWKHLPVGYHGRAGTVIVSGSDVVRPSGQRKASMDAAPDFGPSRRLDIEAEMGFVVGVPSARGVSIAPDEFGQRVFGAVIVNDWSARDIQAWEYVPLGPNLGKSFATSISPWVVPLLALEAARINTPEQVPEPLPYLREKRSWALDIDLEVHWNGELVSKPPYSAMYWSPAQMLAHVTANGASTRIGDFFASGTISGPEKAQRGAFIELTWGGAEPVSVGGQNRTFLEDGDEVIISASAPGPNRTRIDFGDVRGRIVAGGYATVRS